MCYIKYICDFYSFLIYNIFYFIYRAKSRHKINIVELRSLSSRKSVAFQKSFPVTDKAFSYGFYNASLFFIYYIPNMDC